MFFKARFAEVFDFQRHLAGGILAHTGRNTDTAGFGERFQAGRDNNAVAEQVIAFRHHLTLMHADAQA
jgi:hypothetical protein